MESRYLEGGVVLAAIGATLAVGQLVCSGRLEAAIEIAFEHIHAWSLASLDAVRVYRRSRRAALNTLRKQRTEEETV